MFDSSNWLTAVAAKNKFVEEHSSEILYFEILCPVEILTKFSLWDTPGKIGKGKGSGEKRRKKRIGGEGRCKVRKESEKGIERPTTTRCFQMPTFLK